MAVTANIRQQLLTKAGIIAREGIKRRNKIDLFRFHQQAFGCACKKQQEEIPCS
ncbi:hypothetical protein [Rhizobium straminoryzae]|uniref:hypothetical protein n=1 Tax=Rhizobium straminoryzae TaxID=1387186 RepID=UPI00163D9030|nr:hypothetical protein [Rhizobium straminoryzae]